MANPDADERRPEPPLTDRERRQIRKIIEADARATWLATTTRTWLAWIAGVIIALIAISDSLKKVIKGWLA